MISAPHREPAWAIAVGIFRLVVALAVIFAGAAIAKATGLA